MEGTLVRDSLIALSRHLWCVYHFYLWCLSCHFQSRDEIRNIEWLAKVTAANGKAEISGLCSAPLTPAYMGSLQTHHPTTTNL